jgi:hypothetical protein
MPLVHDRKVRSGILPDPHSAVLWDIVTRQITKFANRSLWIQLSTSPHNRGDACHWSWGCRCNDRSYWPYRTEVRQWLFSGCRSSTQSSTTTDKVPEEGIYLHPNQIPHNTKRNQRQGAGYYQCISPECQVSILHELPVSAHLRRYFSSMLDPG